MSFSSINLADQIKSIKPSATLAIAAKAQAMRASGRDIISLSTGEPDFETPDVAKNAAITAIKEGFTHYTAVDGVLSLKQAIARKFKRENHLGYELHQILVSCGVKHSLFNLFHALLNPGDEVIIPSPYWVSYPDMVKLFRGQPVFVKGKMSQDFKITPEALEASITPKTKIFILNSPSNPTGVYYTEAELKALSDVLIKHPQVLIASDDIYEHVFWGEGYFFNIVNVCPSLYERTVVFNGVSKAYAMTGWRIGYAAGPHAVISAMGKIQSQNTSNPNSIAQKAAEAAIASGTTFVKPMVDAFKERHRVFSDLLSGIAGFSLLETFSTFYVFPSICGALEKTGYSDDVAFSDALLEKKGVAVVPGTEFGAPGHIRLSFATRLENLIEAAKRIKAFVENAL